MPQDDGAIKVLAQSEFEDVVVQEKNHNSSRGRVISLISSGMGPKKSGLELSGRLYQPAALTGVDAQDAFMGMPDYMNAVDPVGQAKKDPVHILEAKQGYPLALLNTGNALFAHGEVDQAITCYRQALDISPKFSEAQVNLGNALLAKGEVDSAIECYQQAAFLSPDLPEVYCALGNAVNAKGWFRKAIGYYKKALRLRPDYCQAKNGLTQASRSLVPLWHFEMMNDAARNDAYEQAIRKIVKEDSVVLDIGSGSGLLAMMAARAGAKQVTTCEYVAPIAEKAKDIIEHNGLSKSISVVNKHSKHLKVGRDMPTRADVLITEIFDAGLLGENVISTIEHARDHLLTPDAKIIPYGAKVYATLIESQKLFDKMRVDKVSGFDLSPFNDLAPTSYFQARLSNFPHRMISKEFEVFSFDFCGDQIKRDEQHKIVKVTHDGTGHAIVFWFRLFLDDEIFLDVGPAFETHWKQAIQLFSSPVQLEEGQEVVVFAHHDCKEISFELGLPVK